MVRSEKLIELGNSWFSPKELLGSRRVYNRGVEHWKVSTGSNLAKPIKLRILCLNYSAVRLRGLSSVGQKGNSPDLNLRSLNLCSVHLRWWSFSDTEEVGLEAAIL